MEKKLFLQKNKTASRLSENLEKVQNSVLKNTEHILINQTNRISQFLNNKKISLVSGKTNFISMGLQYY
jgi:hypothetical protein